MLISVASGGKALVNQNPQSWFSLAMYQVCKANMKTELYAKGGIYKLFAGFKTIFNHNASQRQQTKVTPASGDTRLGYAICQRPHKMTKEKRLTIDELLNQQNRTPLNFKHDPFYS